MLGPQQGQVTQQFLESSAEVHALLDSREESREVIDFEGRRGVAIDRHEGWTMSQPASETYLRLGETGVWMGIGSDRSKRPRNSKEARR